MAGTRVARWLRIKPAVVGQCYRFQSTRTSLKSQDRSADQAKFPGAKGAFTNEFKFLDETSYEPIPVYRVINNEGFVIDQNEDPKLDQNSAVNMYKTMIQLNQLDKILYESQRQGRISFYMTNYGEEGVQVGSGAALGARDLVFAQYREAGVILTRGLSLRRMVDQCFGNDLDPGRGRQMPVHYGSRPHNLVTISSPLATQMPQAVGSAYALRRAASAGASGNVKSEGEGSCVICYFGEGAASEGDAHAAFNFAATLQCPVVFFCRNNGWAISTSSSEQYRGDGIAARGPALGLSTVRVDGTDALAVYNAVARARAHTIKHNKPVLIEAMLYRVGHHSTSDDSSAYRSRREVEQWTGDENPMVKMKKYLKNKGWWDETQQAETEKLYRSAVLEALQEAEREPKPRWQDMLTDVYHEMPPHIQKQMQQMEEHLQLYGEHYPLSQYKQD